MERGARIRIEAPAGEVFDWLTTLTHHGRLIPLTRVAAPTRPAAVGDVVTAVTLGLLRDVMVVTRVERPAEPAGPGGPVGRATFSKTGPMLLGWASIEVVPAGETACEVRWTESIHASVWGRRTGGALLTRGGGLMVALALRRARRILARGRRPRGPGCP
ncbi:MULTISPECIES: SRPBCC family protein [unclassified Pseudactinotalea]|uniref:SRPBCC family protein n=1 Tax=unclassified Pseudactinotalea TaxID=2649176 RepID=UPI00128C7ACE|nr:MULTISPECIES: SRPBCC family protein [unclassified Pseudactinotalea]MPV48593.1 hypothetical protein [Pseudactinotalea sp. HY160]QGH68571.1 hypothetical protein GCE65_02890 [Pseudactinotalea sp. HY158]